MAATWLAKARAGSTSWRRGRSPSWTRCEQAHRRMKEELGLDHFEGRSWHGLHHHALMVMVAMAFLQHLRLAEHRRTRPGKNPARRSGAATFAEPARGARGARRPADRAAA